MPVIPPSPAKAGAQRDSAAGSAAFIWTPAFAGELNPTAGPWARNLAPALLLLLAACATQTGAAVEPAAPGFLLGVWHGFIFPFAWVLSLFMPEVAVYAVPNNGGWYDFGYFIGVVFLGVGAWGARRGR